MAANREINTSLVPGMLDLNVGEALEKTASLVVDMRESMDLCKHLYTRLVLLRDQLPKRKNKMNAADHAKVLGQFANTIGLVVRFLKKYSEKKLLQRVAANRLITEGVEGLHGKIGQVFRAASLSNSSKMTEWEEQKEADLITQRSALRNLTQSRSDLVNGLSGSSLEEAVAELKFEIVSCRARDLKALLESVLIDVVSQVDGLQIPDIPVWFIRRDAIEIGVEPFDMGAFGVVHKGTWDNKVVCVKLLFMDGADTQRDFLRETEVWHGLSHAHVVKMLGGCHVGKPLFFVSEFAKHGNFVDFFDRSEENKSKLWRLFFQAAQGLEFLHGKRIVHSDIKCNNILVGTGDDGNDEIAKICDFGFSHIRTLSIGKSVKELPSTARWKAPECLLEQGVAANPTFKSDLYSFGMAIIEAKIGGVPWGVLGEEDIIDQIASEEGYTRPDGIFTDREWELVRGLTEFNPDARISLTRAMDILEELAKDQEAKEKNTEQILKAIEECAKQKEPESPAETASVRLVPCWSCHVNTPAGKFCGECGVPLARSEYLPKA